MTPQAQTCCEIRLVGRDGAMLGRFGPPADFDFERPPPVIHYIGMTFVHCRPLRTDCQGHEYRQVRPLELTTGARLA